MKQDAALIAFLLVVAAILYIMAQQHKPQTEPLIEVVAPAAAKNVPLSYQHIAPCMVPPPGPVRRPESRA